MFGEFFLGHLNRKGPPVATEPEEPEAADEDVITIKDDDGFTTTWPWPKNKTILGNADFVGVFEALHDAQREEQR